MLKTLKQILLSALIAIFSSAARADETPAVESPKPPAATSPVDGQVPLNPQETVFLDAKRKRLLLKTTVVQRRALLEMLLCKSQSKEHESILSIDSEAYVIHAGLLAIGAKVGSPVRFEPEYQPPQGQILDVFVNWSDEDGRPHREKAQKWVRHVTRRYYVEPLAALPCGFEMPDETELRHDPKRGELIWFGQMSEAERDRHLALSDDEAYQAAVRKFFQDGRSKQMEAEFVFAGSSFYVEESGKRHYLAESGNIICVANFSDATIDVAAKSTAQNDDLLFEPYAERVPPLGTEVTVELVLRQEDATVPKKPE